MAEIIIAGFPKSGNTWLTRLLSDALDYPVTGVDDAIPLSAEQQIRNGDGLIRQLHLTPLHLNDSPFAARPFVASRYCLNIDKYNGEKVIHIFRDPRDVTISVCAYWSLGNLPRVVREVIGTGSHPLWGMGWPEFMATWRDTDLPHIETRYEWLHDDTAMELRRLCDRLDLKIVKSLDEVIQRNEINTKRAAIEAMDDRTERLPHGKGAQLTLLRAGRVGDWRAAFNEEACEAAREVFGDWLVKLGYEESAEWQAAPIQTC